MELAIALVLAAVGVAVLLGGYRAWQLLMTRAAQLEAESREAPVVAEPSGAVGPDGLVCLFAHQFVRPAGKSVSARDKAFAALTGDELDPEDFALQLLYSLMAELFQEGKLDFRIVPREPSFMPPFPQKAWELEVRAMEPLSGTALTGAIQVAFELLDSKARRRRKLSPDQDEGWVSIDDLIDRMIRALRQELSFWERTGVYGDLRSYVEDALVAQGYLIPPEKATWLDRVRTKRPQANVEAIERLAGDAVALRARLVDFRRRQGSAEAADAIPQEGPLPITQVDPALIDTKRSLGDLPLDDCLRVSVYEVLTSLKQLEPSSDPGV
jgi:hypothetical protein